MSAKQVYQGVRVKVTVKEMLERKRAREADKKRLRMVSPTRLDLQELYTATFQISAGGFPEPAPTPAPAVVPQPDSVLPPLVFPYAAPDGVQVQAGTFGCTFGDPMLPGFGYAGSNSYDNNNNNIIINNTNNNNNNSGGFSYSPPLPPLTSSPQPWSQELSPQADYCGMGLYSSSESLLPVNHWDYYNNSPQDSFSSSSSSSSSCYNSPTRMESGQPMSFTSEPYHRHYQHCTNQSSYPSPHFWPGQPESVPAIEYPAYDPPDYEWACAMKGMGDENSIRREFAASSGMCYNIL